MNLPDSSSFSHCAGFCIFTPPPLCSATCISNFSGACCKRDVACCRDYPPLVIAKGINKPVNSCWPSWCGEPLLMKLRNWLAYGQLLTWRLLDPPAHPWWLNELSFRKDNRTACSFKASLKKVPWGNTHWSLHHGCVSLSHGSSLCMHVNTSWGRCQ